MNTAESYLINHCTVIRLALYSERQSCEFETRLFEITVITPLTPT